MASELVAACERLAELTKEKRELEATIKPRLKEIEAELAELQATIIRLHPSSGLGGSIKLAMGGTVIISQHMTANVINPDLLVDWYLSRGLKSSLPLNKQSVTADVRAHVAETFENVPGVEVASYPRVTFRS